MFKKSKVITEEMVLIWPPVLFFLSHFHLFTFYCPNMTQFFGNVVCYHILDSRRTSNHLIGFPGNIESGDNIIDKCWYNGHRKNLSHNLDIKII